MQNYRRVIGLDDFATYLCGRISLGQYTKIDEITLTSKFIDCLRSIQQVDDYYFIFHDETDTYHLHYLVYLNRSMRCITLINKIADYMQIDANMILCDKCIEVSKFLKYIVHQDDLSIKEGKKQYQIEDIHSDNPSEVIESFINLKKGQVSFDYLVTIVLKYPMDSQIMRAMTPQLYHRWYREIEILKQERAYLRKEREEKESEDLPF